MAVVGMLFYFLCVCVCVCVCVDKLLLIMITKINKTILKKKKKIHSGFPSATRSSPLLSIWVKDYPSHSSTRPISKTEIVTQPRILASRSWPSSPKISMSTIWERPASSTGLLSLQLRLFALNILMMRIALWTWKPIRTRLPSMF